MYKSRPVLYNDVGAKAPNDDIEVLIDEFLGGVNYGIDRWNDNC